MRQQGGVLIALRALIKGLTGNSLLFSLVYALAVMGFSLAGLLRDPMRAVGLWGPLVFLLPLFLLGKVANWERQSGLDPRLRRTGALLLIVGSTVLALLLWRYERALEARHAGSFEPGPLFQAPVEEGPRLPRGPRGRPRR